MDLLFKIGAGALLLLSAVLLVEFVIAVAMYLSQRGRGRGRGGQRDRSLFACLACVFMSGLLQALGLPIAISHRLRFRGREQCFANISEGTHPTGNITRTSDAVIAERYRLAKVGAAAGAVDVCGAADTPIGVITDEVGTIGDNVNVKLLGTGHGTVRMVASGAISEGALVEPAANGRVQTLGAGAGVHHIVGRALQAAANAADVIEVDHFYFIRDV